MILSSAVICSVGLRRPENQDNFYLNGSFREDPHSKQTVRITNTAVGTAVYAVADGMGGEMFGELASLEAVKNMSEINPDRIEKSFPEHLSKCNEEICKLISANGGVRIGTTFVGICIKGSHALITNIGDSRLYIVRNGVLTQLSVDHSLVQQMVNSGIITPDEARIHPDRHKITQHLGIFPEEMLIEPQYSWHTVQPGDIFLLCSDGLTDMVEDEVIRNIFTHASLRKLPLSTKAEALHTAAMKAGGRDNCTVMLIEAKD